MSTSGRNETNPLSPNEAVAAFWKKKHEMQQEQFKEKQLDSSPQIDTDLYEKNHYLKSGDKQQTTSGNESGRKDDSGKIQAAIIFEDFPLALRELMKVATFGAQKYSRAGWKTVSDKETRYADAKVRHQIDSTQEDNDEESGCDHLAHEAWNTLALLQMKLEKKTSE